MAREVEAVGGDMVLRFHGEAREEVDLIFKELQADLELTDIIARRVNGEELPRVRECVKTIEFSLPAMKHYEIDKAVIERIEEMRSDLNAWAGELRARGQAPSGPASAPL
jgi:hypothetical protein